MRRASLLLIGVIAASACDFQVRVPITNVNAAFSLADATWFEEEGTLFVFYRVDAEQGLGPESQIEIAWRTDVAEQDFIPLHTITPVHTHVTPICGPKSKCGSTSIPIFERPRDVRIRLRYHREGEVFLDAPVTFNPIARGPAHVNRSLIVYGVFDETNTRVQWRARHNFPVVRNEEAEALGLRRRFVISDPRHGAVNVSFADNPYGYGFASTCPQGLVPLGWPLAETTDRAMFDPNALPPNASTSPALCGRSTVTDAKGEFDAPALARKNPEVSPGFPLLRSPVKQNTAIGYVLRICDRTISEEHVAMQVQRLLLETSPQICIDDWQRAGFANGLASQFRARIDEARSAGRDMVLMFALHHDNTDGRLAAVIEDALRQVLVLERDRTSPRVSGAFVFDSYGHAVADADVGRLTLWCPADLPTDDLEAVPTAAQRSCPVQPDQNLELGPFRFGTLPILATRAQYERFIERYSAAQAGRTRSLTFRAPERTPVSENVPIGQFGVATFFDNEVMTAAPTDRFSYCPPEDGSPDLTVFRISLVPDVIPLSSLPDLHEQFPQSAYELGLAWDFPFLLRIEYEAVTAGAASAYGLSVPFGLGSTEEAYAGSTLWEKGEFPVGERLTRCTRFCDHPTFGPAGVYNVTNLFIPTYRAACYRPSYPVPGDGGFPRDP